MGVFLPSLWKFRPMDNIPTIMNYELCIMNYPGDHKGSPLRQIPIPQMDFLNNYELCIMNYEL